MRDPWFKATLNLSALGQKLQMQIPHDVFSTQRIDEGTLLLLEHLPSREPATVLDMGCGYGALGLPIAWLTERTTMPGKGLVYTIMTLGLLIPGIYTAMGWTFIAHVRIGLLNRWLMDVFAIEQ